MVLNSGPAICAFLLMSAVVLAASSNLLDPCSDPITSYVQNADHLPKRMCDQWIVQKGTKGDNLAVANSQDDEAYLCADFYQSSTVKSFLLIFRMDTLSGVDLTTPSNYYIGVYQNYNLVGKCVESVAGMGWYNCDEIYEGDSVCVKTEVTGVDFGLAELLIFDKYTIQTNARSLTATEVASNQDLQGLIAPQVFINVLSQNTYLTRYFFEITSGESPVISLLFNAQIEFSSVILLPYIIGQLQSNYRMPQKDETCRNWKNTFLISIKDVYGTVYECTSLSEISTFKESTCNGAEGIQVDVALDLNNLGQESQGDGLCTYSYPILAFSSFGVLYDCDCSKTSLEIDKMPVSTNLIPNIPEDLQINLNEDPINIIFPCGYDTVSYNCGPADGYSFCDSISYCSAKFTDNQNGVSVDLPYSIFQWKDQNLIIQATSEEQIGYHSLKVTLQLDNYPTATSRSFDVSLTVISSTSQDQDLTLANLTFFAIGYTEKVNQVHFTDFLGSQSSVYTSLELSQTRIQNLQLATNGLTLQITSNSKQDNSTYSINLLAMNLDNPNVQPQPIILSYQLKNPDLQETNSDSYQEYSDEAQQENQQEEIQQEQESEDKSSVDFNTFTSAKLIETLQFIQENQQQVQQPGQTQKNQFLYLDSFDSQGYLTIKSSCRLNLLENPNRILQENEFDGSFSYPNMALILKEGDQDMPVLRNQSNTTISVFNMTENTIKLHFNFAQANQISTQESGIDFVQVTLLNKQLIKCNNGQIFQNVNSMEIAIPPQLTSLEKDYIANVKKTTKQAKNVSLAMSSLRLIFKSAINEFLSSIFALNFISFQIGMSLIFPAVLTSFFAELLGILNQDLLDSFSWAQFEYIPRQFLVESFSYQLGFIGFDSTSFISNIGTMVWIILFNLSLIIIVLIGSKFLNFKNSKMTKWFREQKKEYYFNGIIEKVNEFELTLIIVAQIQLEGIIKHLHQYSFSYTDILMGMTLLMFPLIKFVLCVLTWKNYEKLKDEKSQSSLLYGKFVDELQLEKIPKDVALKAACREFIKRIALVLILTRASSMSWLQIMSMNFLIEFDGIFIIFYHPYGKRTQKQQDEQLAVIQCMFFNYFVLCMSDFVQDFRRRQEVGIYTIYFIQAIILHKIFCFVIPNISLLVLKLKYRQIRSKRLKKLNDKLKQNELQRKKYANYQQQLQFHELKSQTYANQKQKLLNIYEKFNAEDLYSLDKSLQKKEKLQNDKKIFKVYFIELKKLIQKETFYFEPTSLNFNGQSRGIKLKLPDPTLGMIGILRQHHKDYETKDFIKQVNNEILQHVKTQQHILETNPSLIQECLKVNEFDYRKQIKQIDYSDSDSDSDSDSSDSSEDCPISKRIKELNRGSSVESIQESKIESIKESEELEEDFNLKNNVQFIPIVTKPIQNRKVNNTTEKDFQWTMAQLQMRSKRSDKVDY